jgi:hypothetical protein
MVDTIPFYMTGQTKEALAMTRAKNGKKLYGMVYDPQR